MTVSALVSGGKDSIFSAYLADSQGLEVDELVVLEPDDEESFMFHTPNLKLVELQARAWGKRLRRVRVEGAGERPEADALRRALEAGGRWVSAGAIASSYQWARLERLTFELGRRLFAPLWGKEAARVVQAEIGSGMDVRLVRLAAEPLPSDALGARLDSAMLERFERLSSSLRAFNVAGEGGEFETLVVDAPFFRERIVLDEAEATREGTASTLRIRRAHLEPKPTRTGVEAVP